MTAKEYLQQVYQLNAKIESKLEQIAHLQATATKVTTVITGTPNGGNRLSSRVEDAVVSVQQQADCLVNEITLINPAGSVSLRIGNNFTFYRKVGKCHQNVLVFYKGADQRKIKSEFGEVKIALPVDKENF